MNPRNYQAHVHVLEAGNLSSPDDTPLHLEVTLGANSLSGGKYKTFKNVLQVYEKFSLGTCMPGAAVVIIRLFSAE